jgi:DNA-binding protein HU-beta
MDKKLLQILDSYGLEVITDVNNPRFVKETKFDAKKLISEINGSTQTTNSDLKKSQNSKKVKTNKNNTTNKTDLIDAVTHESGLNRHEVKIVIENLIAAIINDVADGKKVQITGFGSFERKARRERNIRNPRTSEHIKVPPSKKPSFSAGSIFKEKVNK